MSTPIKEGQTPETADQRTGSPGQHMPYNETLSPPNSRTNSLVPSLIASHARRPRTASTSATASTPEPRTGSPGHHMRYNQTLIPSTSRLSASSATPATLERSTFASSASTSSIATTASTSALHFSSSSGRKNSTASTDDKNFAFSASSKPTSSPILDADGTPFATYKTSKPAKTNPPAPTASVSSTKPAPVKDTATPGSYFIPYSTSASTSALASLPTAPVSAFKPTKTESNGLSNSPYQQWTRLNPNPNPLPSNKTQSVSPLKQAKSKVITNDLQDGTSTPPHPLQFMSLQSPAKPVPAPRVVDRSPSPAPAPAPAEDNVSGRMSRGFHNPSPPTPISSPSPIAVPSESGLFSPTSPSSGMLSPSGAEISSPTPSFATLSASSVSPTSNSISPSSASSTPSPHEASKKGYISYDESRNLPKPTTRKLNEQERIERSEEVISGLSFGPSRVRKAPQKGRPVASEASGNAAMQESMNPNQK